jgi:hypothetical protein
MNNINLGILRAVAYTFEALSLLIVVLIPIRQIAIGGTLGKALLRMWMYYIIWAVSFCFLMPVSISWITGDKRVYDCFPDMPGIMAAVALGWLPALLICGITAWIRTLMKPK